MIAISQRAFTIVELMLIIAVIATLGTIVTIYFSSWQHRTAENSVKSDLRQAFSGLTSYENFNNDYPPNLAGVGFAASENVALTLKTNAPQLRTYEGLTTAQNAQLFLNSCNANMPVTSGGTTYNTACVFSGNNIHVGGTNSSNVVIQGPTVELADITLVCGAACDAAVASMISDFTSQNGTFPLVVPKQQSALPESTMTTYGSASEYCLEGRAANFSDIVYHVTHQDSSVQSGACPENANLHYP